MVGHAGGVVDVQVADRTRPVVGGVAVLRRFVHVAQRRLAEAGADDLLADQVVTGVGGVVRVPLHHRAEDVRRRLVQASGLARVGQPRRLGRHPVCHLVARHVQRHQRAERRPVAVAVRHAEATVVPEGVVVAVAVVDAVVRALAVVADAVPAVDVLVVVPRLVRAVLRVHGRARAVGRRARAPVVVGVREQGRGRPGDADAEDAQVRLVRGVARVGVAPGRVGELVGRAARGGLQRDRPAVERTAVPRRRLDAVPRVDPRSRAGVRQDRPGHRVAQ